MPGSINYRLLFLVFTIAASIFFSSCSSDQKPTYVDLSKKMIEDQPGEEPRNGSEIRVAVAAMISPRETVVYYHQLLDFIATQLGHKIQLVQRKTYGEINELLKTGKIDLAFICSGPYATSRQTYGFEALAVPLVRGRHSYHSYLIVNQKSKYRDLSDLRGKTFAFTDPESNAGAHLLAESAAGKAGRILQQDHLYLQPRQLDYGGGHLPGGRGHRS